VGGRTLASDGRDFAHQGAARIRAAFVGDRRILAASRRMGRAVARTRAREFRRALPISRRAESLVLQFLHNRRRRGRDRCVRGAVRNLVAHDGFRKGPPDGLSRERRPLLRAVRPSRANLSLCVRDLRADGAVVGAPAGGVGRSTSSAPNRRRARARIASRWFISGRRSYSSRSRDRAAATTSCRFCPLPRCSSRECSRFPMRFVRRSRDVS